MKNSKLVKFATEKAMLSPLCVGEKLTTEQLVSKKIIVKNADLVSYTETNTKTGEENNVAFVVLAVYDEKGKYIGYYQGGKALTEIFADVLADEDYAKEMRADGVKIKLTPKRTRGGNNFTAAEVWG